MIDANLEWSDVPDDTPERLGANEAARIGRYTLCRRLADGGMGTVYLAKAEGPGGFERAFAIKRIHPHLARRKDLVEMFLDEARLSARIHHPNVCATVDFGEADGTWFLAMEYLLGESLANLVREVAVTPGLLGSARWRGIVTRLIADAAEGLHAAHELTDGHGAPLGLVHRDVSPQNLFVTYDGAVKVLDFGVALAAGRIHQTRAGALKGKVAYMAPEQVSASPVDRRVDVFALGVCLWEALTGRRLFKRETDVETIQSVMSLAIVPPSAHEPGVEPALDHAVMAALACDPEARTASARALAEALEAYLHERARPTTRADVASLMSERFAGRRLAKAEIVRTELAGGEERSGVVVVSPPPPREPTASLAGPGAAPRIGEATPSFVPAPSAPPPRLAPAPASAAPLEAPPSRRRALPWVILGAVLATAAAGAGLIALGADEAPRGATTIVPAVPPRPAPAPPLAAPLVEVPPAPAPVAVAPPATEEAASPPAARRRRAPPAPTTADATPGRVNVVTRGGWADVYVGGRLLGRTPRSVELPPGDHVLELRPYGRSPGRRVPVHIEPGSVERVVEQVSTP